MRSLSAFNLAAIDNPYVDSISLVKIELSGLTLYLCDRVFGSGYTECVFDGQLYEPIITNIGNANHGALVPVKYNSNAGKFSFAVDNTVTIGPSDYFSKLFLIYSFYFAPVTFYQIYEGASSGDEIVRFKGFIENHSDMAQSEIEITCSGPELTLSDSFTHDIVEAVTYPGCDPDDLGKMLPQVYGSAKRVPLISIDAGSITTLVNDLTATSGTIDVSDASKFPLSGTIQIGLEQITYTSITYGINRLAGCLRGQNGTEAVPHTSGANVAEVQSSYWYIMGHAVNAINEVYVDGVRQDGNYTAYTGQTGDNDPSGLYDGLACVRFDVLPIIAKQINVEMDEGDHEHASIQYPISSWKMDSVVLTGGFVANLEQLIDENFITGAHFFGNGAVTFNKTIGEWLGGTGPTRGQLGFVIHSNPNSHNCRCYFPNLGDMYRSTPGTYRGGWQDLSSLTWTQLLALTGIVRNYATPDGTLAEISIFIEIEYDDASASSPATGVDFAGNTVAETVIGGLVAVDVDGFQDDGSGTYTGTPNALIERPDHIMTHLLIDRCGKAAADIDSTSYTASGSEYSLKAFRLGIALLDQPDIRKLMYDIATQSRSIAFWESGTHHLVYIPPVVDPVDKTLDSRIDINTVSIRPANRNNIKNKMSATYDKHWSGKDEIESEQAVVTASSPDSITKYGTLEAPRTSFPYILDIDQALDVIYWLQANQKDAIVLLEFVGGHHLMELEKGDIVDFTFVADDQLDKSFLGLVSTDASFRVVDLSYENENVRLLLETGTDGLTPAFNLIGFNPIGGYYETSQDVELSTSVVGASIYYTTDGSDPDTGDTLYTGTPITVSDDMTIKARLFVGAQAAGPIQTEVYEIYIETYWRLKASQIGSETAIRSMIVFDDKIYAGTSPGGKLVEWNGSNAWVEKAAVPGNYVFALCEFNGNLYAGMGLSDGDLYEWNGVDAWVSVASQYSSENRIYSLAVFDGKLYGGTYPNGHLLEWNGVDAWILRSGSGSTGYAIPSLLEFNGSLYGTAGSVTGSDDLLYEWNGSNAWAGVAPRIGTETTCYDLCVFNGKLYAGTAAGGTLVEWNEVDAWVEKAPGAFGQTYITNLAVHDAKLYGGAGLNAKLLLWNGTDAWVEASGQAGSETYTLGLVLYNNRIYCGTVGLGQLYEYVGII